LSGNHLRSLASPRLTSAAVVDYPLQTFAAEGDRKDVAFQKDSTTSPRLPPFLAQFSASPPAGCDSEHSHRWIFQSPSRKTTMYWLGLSVPFPH